MTNIELQKILSDRITVALSDLTPEQREIENSRTGLILGISKHMIKNGDLLMKADLEYGKINKPSKVKDMILGDATAPGWMKRK